MMCTNFAGVICMIVIVYSADCAFLGDKIDESVSQKYEHKMEKLLRDYDHSAEDDFLIEELSHSTVKTGLDQIATRIRIGASKANAARLLFKITDSPVEISFRKAGLTHILDSKKTASGTLSISGACKEGNQYFDGRNNIPCGFERCKFSLNSSKAVDKIIDDNSTVPETLHKRHCVAITKHLLNNIQSTVGIIGMYAKVKKLLKEKKFDLVDDSEMKFTD